MRRVTLPRKGAGNPFEWLLISIILYSGGELAPLAGDFDICHLHFELQVRFLSVINFQICADFVVILLFQVQWLFKWTLRRPFNARIAVRRVHVPWAKLHIGTFLNFITRTRALLPQLFPTVALQINESIVLRSLRNVGCTIVVVVRLRVFFVFKHREIIFICSLQLDFADFHLGWREKVVQIVIPWWLDLGSISCLLRLAPRLLVRSINSDGCTILQTLSWAASHKPESSLWVRLLLCSAPNWSLNWWSWSSHQLIHPRQD